MCLNHRPGRQLRPLYLLLRGGPATEAHHRQVPHLPEEPAAGDPHARGGLLKQNAKN